jgi:hypothetical protein
MPALVVAGQAGINRLLLSATTLSAQALFPRPLPARLSPEHTWPDAAAAGDPLPLKGGDGPDRMAAQPRWGASAALQAAIRDGAVTVLLCQGTAAAPPQQPISFRLGAPHATTTAAQPQQRSQTIGGSISSQ